MTVFVPLSTQPVLFNGQYQIGAILQVFDAQTLTPRTVYKDGLATIPWLQATPGNPVPAGAYVTDGSARIPVAFIVGNPYRIRCISKTGQQIFDIDNLPGDTAVGGGGGGGGGGGAAFQTGDYVWAHTTAIIPGRVRANGKTIGDASSGATERANGDCQNLFVFLWNSDASLPVSGLRGASAIADFTAHKTITLPDMNGRIMAGIDGMGASATGRLGGGLFATGSATVLGSTGGEAAHALTNFENATHGHTGITLANAAFQMTFTTSTVAGHDHGGLTGLENATHYHIGTTGFESANHTHAGATDTQGSHNHSGVTSFESANHTHNYSGSTSTVQVNPGATFNVATASGTNNLTTTSQSVDHTHSFSTSTDGAHSHAVTTGTQSSNHTHSFTSGTQSANHAHSITIDGSHFHTGSTNLGGAHVHTFATDLSGGGDAHNNLAPFMLATCYIVL